jgi:hypothetical protein
VSAKWVYSVCNATLSLHSLKNNPLITFTIVRLELTVACNLNALLNQTVRSGFCFLHKIPSVRVKILHCHHVISSCHIFLTFEAQIQSSKPGSFQAHWLLYVPPGLNFIILPTQCIYTFYTDIRKKQRLFPHTALTEWFYYRDGACLLRGTS